MDARLKIFDRFVGGEKINGGNGHPLLEKKKGVAIGSLSSVDLTREET